MRPVSELGVQPQAVIDALKAAATAKPIAPEALTIFILFSKVAPCLTGRER